MKDSVPTFYNYFLNVSLSSGDRTVATSVCVNVVLSAHEPTLGRKVQLMFTPGLETHDCHQKGTNTRSGVSSVRLRPWRPALNKFTDGKRKVIGCARQKHNSMTSVDLHFLEKQ